MNKNTTLAIVFLLAGTLLTTVVATAPAAFAGGDGYDGEGNYNSAKKGKAQLNDCDGNKAAHYALQACVNIIKPFLP